MAAQIKEFVLTHERMMMSDANGSKPEKLARALVFNFLTDLPEWRQSLIRDAIVEAIEECVADK